MRPKNLRSIASANKRLGLAFLLPGLGFLFVFLIIPILYSMYMSVFEWEIFDLGRERVFVGFDNFIRAFTDKLFLNAAGNTLLIVGVCLAFELVIGFIIALLIWNIQRPLKLLHAVILLPMITSPVIVALIWRLMYHPNYGIMNYVLKYILGLPAQAWLGDANLALPSIMLVDIWQMTPFVVLILYAALINIPADCIEAAFVDGASYGQMVRCIILPFMGPAILLVLMMRTMDLVRIFDTVFILTGGGPMNSTETLSTYIHKTGFQQYEMGYSMALSLITLACIILISIGYAKARKRGG